MTSPPSFTMSFGGVGFDSDICLSKIILRSTLRSYLGEVLRDSATFKAYYINSSGFNNIAGSSRRFGKDLVGGN